MKTVEIVRGTFEGKYHQGDQVAVGDPVAAILVKENFAKIVPDPGSQNTDPGQYDFASSEEILAMSTKKELEMYAASIGMPSLDSKLKIKDMQTAILNYQDELIDKADEQ